MAGPYLSYFVGIINPYSFAQVVRPGKCPNFARNLRSPVQDKDLEYHFTVNYRFTAGTTGLYMYGASRRLARCAATG